MKLAIKVQCVSGLNVLRQLGRITTGLYNVANYERKQIWESTGRLPTYVDQCRDLKNHKLVKVLHSQVAQQTLNEIDRAYKSYFALKKNGHTEAEPPRFRKPKKPKSVWFTPSSFKVLSPTEIRFSISNLGLTEKYLVVRIIPDDRHDITELNIKMINVTFDGDKVFASLCLEIEEPQIDKYEDVIAVDLGICNLAATIDTKGHESIISGRKLLSIQRYFNKKVARLQSIKDKQDKKNQKKSTKTIRRLKRKQSRQVKHLLHIASKQLVEQAKKQKACLVVGDLTNIRKSSPSINKKEVKKKNQKIHSWSFATFTSLLKYKCQISGVQLFQVGERYTSRRCPQCGVVKRSNRQKRGHYKCSCGYVCNADINGAKNILFKFLGPENVSPLSVDNGVVVRGVDLSLFKFDSSKLNRRRIPVALA